MNQKKWPTGNKEVDNIIFIIVKFLFGFLFKKLEEKNQPITYGSASGIVQKFEFNPAQILKPTPAKFMAAFVFVTAFCQGMQPIIEGIDTMYISESFKYYAVLFLKIFNVFYGIIAAMHGKQIINEDEPASNN